MNEKNKADGKSSDPSNQEEREGLGIFEKYLPVWIALCIAIGILLSQIVPALSVAINSWQIAGVSITIGICCTRIT